MLGVAAEVERLLVQLDLMDLGLLEVTAVMGLVVELLIIMEQHLLAGAGAEVIRLLTAVMGPLEVIGLKVLMQLEQVLAAGVAAVLIIPMVAMEAYMAVAAEQMVLVEVVEELEHKAFLLLPTIIILLTTLVSSYFFKELIWTA
jgi:hypothetical protein